MMTALTVAILVVGFVVSVWAGSRVSRSIIGETTEGKLHRQERMIRRVITALGCGFTVMIIGAIWLQEATISAHEANDLGLAASAAALDAARTNCINQQEAQAANERALIADVRLATAQSQSATEAVLKIDERLLQDPLPDPSGLSPEIQDYLARAQQQGRERTLEERERLSGLRTRWENELATRQEALDEAREQRITSCPRPHVVIDGEKVVEIPEVEVEVTTGTT
jgi:hypothetical protein